MKLHEDTLRDVRDHAVNALTVYLASVIRQDEDPDHSGPEDAANEVAELFVELAEIRLMSVDWRNHL